MCGAFFYARVQTWFDATHVFAFAHAYSILVVGDLYCIVQRMAG